MIYPNTFEQKISFDKIRDHLSEYCLCSLGKELVDKMSFSVDYDEVKSKVHQTIEFVKVIADGDFPDQNFYDVRPALQRIRIENTCLDVEELFNLQRSLNAICDIVRYLHKYEDDEKQIPLYPSLFELTTDVAIYPQLIRRIDHILDKFGHVKDSASPTLMMIRRELAATAGSVSRSLNNILKSAKSDGLIDKDVSPTLRDGRLVIPVAPSMKRKIGGIVHDESDTGKTVYIEPAEVVEANNKIRELESEERKEIRRILMEFTQLVRPEISEMLKSYEFLAIIDFIRAKAKFAIITESSEPQIENRQIIDWSIAIHPILALSFKSYNMRHPEEAPRKVEPLDIKLTTKQRLLIISGPNAGGKSVCLKTTGLLQYMLQCGMPVPVAKSSVFGMFGSIFIDIGDEQSIENDLSTYSSHLLNMKNMMKHCDGKSLILIDEFGGGTEPLIGAAIAEAMLSQYTKKRTFGVITTHYQSLKHYAQNTEGVINGAMLYDRQMMKPLFQLAIGNPGSSFAIEIARKTGIPDEVIRDASDIVGTDYINSDKYLQDIVRDKRYWENKRQAIHQHEKQMEQTIARYEAEIQKLHDERKHIIARAKDEAEQLLKESNARIEKTIRDIKEAQAEKERTRLIRQEFNEYKQEVNELDTSLADEKIRRQMEKLIARRKRKEDKKNNPYGTDAVTTPRNELQVLVPSVTQQNATHTFVAGDHVKIKGQTTIGNIQKVNGNEATVVFGSITINVKLSRLIPSEPPKKERQVASTFVSVSTQEEIRNTTLNFKHEIDLRGMRGDEALQAVTYFIDDACVARARQVKILHGTGSGILKTLIRQLLATIPIVESFHDEDIRFGGAGITVVNLT